MARWRKRAGNWCVIGENGGGRGWIDTQRYIWNFIQLCQLWRVTSFELYLVSHPAEVSPPSEAKFIAFPSPTPVPFVIRSEQYAERRIPSRGVARLLRAHHLLTHLVDDFFFEPNWTPRQAGTDTPSRFLLLEYIYHIRKCVGVSKNGRGKVGGATLPSRIRSFYSDRTWILTE